MTPSMLICTQSIRSLFCHLFRRCFSQMSACAASAVNAVSCDVPIDDDDSVRCRRVYFGRSDAFHCKRRSLRPRCFAGLQCSFSVSFSHPPPPPPPHLFSYPPSCSERDIQERLQASDSNHAENYYYYITYIIIVLFSCRSCDSLFHCRPLGAWPPASAPLHHATMRASASQSSRWSAG